MAAAALAAVSISARLAPGLPKAMPPLRYRQEWHPVRPAQYLAQAFSDSADIPTIDQDNALRCAGKRAGDG